MNSRRGISILKGIFLFIGLIIICLIGAVLVLMIVPSIFVGISGQTPGAGFQEIINFSVPVYLIIYWLVVLIIFYRKRKKS